MKAVASTLGRQSLVGSTNVNGCSSDWRTTIANDEKNEHTLTLKALWTKLNALPVRRVYLGSVLSNSIGIGLYVKLAGLLLADTNAYAGFIFGIGNKLHLAEGLKAIVTEYFGINIGDRLRNADKYSVDSEIDFSLQHSVDYLRAGRA